MSEKLLGEIVTYEDLKGLSFDSLDQIITAAIRDWSTLGAALIEMRDGQAYRKYGFNSFEDYCKSKAGLSVSEAQRTICYAIGFTELLKPGAAESRPPVLPETKAQMQALLPAATFKVEEREYVQQHPTEGEKRQKVKQPVGLKNPKAFREQWAKTVKAFDEQKAKAEAEGKKLPTFSGKFIRNQLPNQLKVTPDRGFNCNPLVRLAARMDKLHEDIQQQGFADRRKVGVLITAEPPCLSAQLGDLKNQLELVAEDVAKMIEILGEYE